MVWSKPNFLNPSLWMTWTRNTNWMLILMSFHPTVLTTTSCRWNTCLKPMCSWVEEWYWPWGSLSWRSRSPRIGIRRRESNFWSRGQGNVVWKEIKKFLYFVSNIVSKINFCCEKITNSVQILHNVCDKKLD